MIKHLIINEFGVGIIDKEIDGIMPILVIDKGKILSLFAFLKTNENCYFDSLSCLTAIDNGVESGTFEIVYNLYSIPFGHKLALKIIIDRSEPKAFSACNVWQSANWAEREVFDMYGIVFEGHPDLRRILLPEDWEGHPLKKDYIQQEIYHGITVKY